LFIETNLTVAVLYHYLTLTVDRNADKKCGKFQAKEGVNYFMESMPRFSNYACSVTSHYGGWWALHH